ncbi:hypothetical protein B0T24DRAFT_644234 [Lasiosphaeria ovina]|uniref:Uncharacterized protein n=1 Tax=Lasiosphaeria ovina TaxID=92902 RepID=A0AAE0MYQ5_9PEZI|nr:hypothetical protein B0T24DRAFT_644234 [Lasiosphaeria ovina]
MQSAIRVLCVQRTASAAQLNFPAAGFGSLVGVLGGVLPHRAAAHVARAALAGQFGGVGRGGFGTGQREMQTPGSSQVCMYKDQEIPPNGSPRPRGES